MLEFRENQPRRRLAPTVLKVAGAVALVLCAAAALLLPRLRRGGTDVPEDPGAASEAALFGPSDEWVVERLAEIDTPTVAGLAPLVEAAPNSLVLLRYLASISNPKAAAAVAARIVELSPRFPRPPTSFEGRILWRGSRRVGGDGTPLVLRHHFLIPSGAARLFRACVVETRFAGFNGEPLAADDFALNPDAATVVSYSVERDALEFFVERPIPSEVAAADGGWSLELGVATGDGGRPLRPDGGVAPAGGTRVRIDFFE